jgi:hypothetical protein
LDPLLLHFGFTSALPGTLSRISVKTEKLYRNYKCKCHPHAATAGNTSHHNLSRDRVKLTDTPEPNEERKNYDGEASQ